MTDVKYQHWLDVLERLWQKTVHLAHVDDVFWQMQAIAKSNENLRLTGGVLLDWMLHTYLTTTLVGIRALVDGSKNTISFRKLLEEMCRDAPTVLTRERFRGLYRPEMRWRADIDFDRFAGTGALHVPRDRIREDLQQLEDAIRTVNKYTNERIAHMSVQPNAEAPTYLDVRYALKAVADVLRKYTLLLRAGSMTRVVPSIGEPWLEAFQNAWLPAGVSPPSYVELDDLPPRSLNMPTAETD